MLSLLSVPLLPTAFFFFFLVGGVVLFLQPHDKHATEIGLIFLGGLEIFFLDTSRN